MHTLLLFGFIAVLSSSAQGQVPCGCPYKPKIGPAYDPTKLFIMDGSDKSCALTCENGYVLENHSNYVECTNGQKWLGQKRWMFGVEKLVDNPFLTCVKVTEPQNCPDGTWKTFDCKNCDPFKIMEPSNTKGECTIMCDKGYRLVSNQGAGANIALAEATLKSSSWTMYALNAIQTATFASAAAVSFSCEMLPGTKPKPPPCGCGYDFLDGDEYDQTQLTASGIEGGTCRVECKTGYAVVSDLVSGPMPYATCAQSKWSAPGKGDLNDAVPLPKFSCAKIGTPPEPACKKCPDSMITMKSNGAAVFSTAIDLSGTCAVRTFVCTGKEELATIELNGSDLETISDEGTVTLSVNCNAAGTAWTSCGKPVTHLECSSAEKPGCKRCGDDLITITTTGALSKPMTSDTRDDRGKCTTRTFVCEGPNAVIEINEGAGTISGDDGRATFTVVCNEGEAGWATDGVNIKQLECSYGREKISQIE